MDRLRPQQFHVPSLDALNFLVADVRGALAPYVTVYLAASLHWNLAAVGLVMTLGGWLGLATQTPLGWLLDATTHKRGLLALVLAANGVMQVVSGIFTPAVAALTVGLFRRRDLTRRMGRNAAFGRAGNLSIAIIAAVVAWAVVAWKEPARGVFFVVPVLAAGGIIAALSIPQRAIGLRRARADQRRKGGERAGGHADGAGLIVAQGLLEAFLGGPYLLIGVKLLGGIGIGLFAALALLVVWALMPEARPDLR